MRVLVCALVLAACSDASAPRTETPRFVDTTRAAGLEFVHDAGLTPEKQLPETMGAGAALFDFDGDGDLDLYCVQSGPLPLGDRADAPPNRLYANDGEGRFVDVTHTSGDAAHRGYGMGVATGDVNGDGHADLFVTNVGPDVLLLGDGTGHFRDATGAAGLADPRWTTSALCFDPDEDGDLDLYVCGYLDVDLDDPPFCGRREPGWRSVCHPDRFAGIADRYWENDGTGRFTDATGAAGLTDADHPGKGLGVIASDFDDDGHLDLYVANDSVENRLWIGNGDGTFKDGTLLSGTGVNHEGATEAGMGVATGDADGDGRIDLFVTNFDDESNTLYKNEGDGMFADVSAESGLDAPSRLLVGFGTVLFDFDHDGDLDIAVANGHIVDNIHLYHDGKTWKQRAQLFANDGTGRFKLDSPSSGDLGRDPLVGRGLYAGDVDGDGWLDLVLTQCGGPLRLFRNTGGGSDASGARYVAAPTPGTRVRVTFADGSTLVREGGGQGSYLGAGANALHLTFGTRIPRAAEMRVPGGAWVALDLRSP